MDFARAEKDYTALKQARQSGKLSEDEFKTQLRDLMVQDDSGAWWMLGVKSGRWYRFEDDGWVRRDPQLAAKGDTAVTLDPIHDSHTRPARPTPPTVRRADARPPAGRRDRFPWTFALIYGVLIALLIAAAVLVILR
jgi:hypothetical protein